MHGSPAGSMTVGVVGAGGIAQPHLEAWRHLGAHLLLQSPERAEEMAQRYGAVVTRDLDELLARCDVVDICTPTRTHHDIVLRAAAAGRHVICEKPLSNRWEEAVSMI
ncbi:MAG: Gfo/Idh/MocA family oxidoreductase, partial [Terracoccus sp.]